MSIHVSFDSIQAFQKTVRCDHCHNYLTSKKVPRTYDACMHTYCDLCICKSEHIKPCHAEKVLRPNPKVGEIVDSFIPFLNALGLGMGADDPAAIHLHKAPKAPQEAVQGFMPPQLGADEEEEEQEVQGFMPPQRGADEEEEEEAGAAPVFDRFLGRQDDEEEKYASFQQTFEHNRRAINQWSLKDMPPIGDMVNRSILHTLTPERAKALLSPQNVPIGSFILSTTTWHVNPSDLSEKVVRVSFKGKDGNIHEAYLVFDNSHVQLAKKIPNSDRRLNLILGTKRACSEYSTFEPQPKSPEEKLKELVSDCFKIFVGNSLLFEALMRDAMKNFSN